MRRRRLLASLAGLPALSAGAGCLAGDRPDRLIWHTPVGPDDPTGIAVADGVVAVPKSFETFGVERDGSVTWKRFDYGGPVVPVGDGFLAVGAPNYHPRNAENPAVLHRLAAAGPVRWERPTGTLSELVGVDADRARVYVLRATGGRESGDRGDLLVARALSDGRVLWRERLEAPARGPRVADGTLVTAGRDVVGRDPTSGAVRWRRAAVGGRWPPAVGPAQSGDTGRVYVTREAPPTVQVLGSDGRAVGRYDLPGDRARGPTAVAGGVGVVRTTAGAWAVDPTTGERRWRWPGEAPVARSDPRATVGTTDRGLVVVDEGWGVATVTRAGRLAWRVTVDGGFGVAAAGDGRVYAAGGRGLYALGG